MNFYSFIVSQKERIRLEHANEIELICGDGQTVVLDIPEEPRCAEEIFRELNGLRGLNTEERKSHPRISREREFSFA